MFKVIKSDDGYCCSFNTFDVSEVKLEIQTLKKMFFLKIRDSPNRLKQLLRMKKKRRRITIITTIMRKIQTLLIQVLMILTMILVMTLLMMILVVMTLLMMILVMTQMLVIMMTQIMMMLILGEEQASLLFTLKHGKIVLKGLIF